MNRYTGRLAKMVGVTLTFFFASAGSAEVVCENRNLSVKPTTPTIDFADNGDGTVTHHKTHLMWMRCSLGQEWDELSRACLGSPALYTWAGGLNAVLDSNRDGGHSGYDDWRLPNKNELASIVERSCYSPAINAAVFPQTPTEIWFFSSTPFYTEDHRLRPHVWLVDFTLGSVRPNIKGQEPYAPVRLVRAGR